jgi:hypothetical protein
LDQQDRIMKGGKDDEAIISGTASSELAEKILLPREERHQWF